MRGSALCSLLSFAGTLGFILAGCGASADEGTPSGAAGDMASSGGSGTGGTEIGTGGTSGGSGGPASSGAGGYGGTPGAGGAMGKAGAGGGGGSGVSGGAGTGGSGGSTPHTVSPCPTANSADIVGTWTDVTPSQVNVDPKFGGFNTGVTQFVINPKDTANLYLGTHSQGVYKSVDCGATWTHISTGKNGDLVDSGRNWTMAIDPQDPQVLYVNSGYGKAEGLWKSTNGGVDWTQLFPTGSEFSKNVEANFVEVVSIDPTDHNHLVVSSHGKCTGVAAGNTCLAESLDAGSTWKMLKAEDGFGYEAAGQAIVDHDHWLFFNSFTGIFLTKDAGATWTNVYSGGATNSTGEMYRGSNGAYYVASSKGVLTSTDLTKWTVIPKSPNSSVVVGDGTNMFTSVSDVNPTTPYSMSHDGVTWAAYPSPPVAKGSWTMKYDVDHHLLYSSNGIGGFRRVKTQ